MSPIQWNLLQILLSLLEVIASLLTVSVDRVYNFTLTAWCACPLLQLLYHWPLQPCKLIEREVHIIKIIATHDIAHSNSV